MIANTSDCPMPLTTMARYSTTTPIRAGPIGVADSTAGLDTGNYRRRERRPTLPSACRADKPHTALWREVQEDDRQSPTFYRALWQMAVKINGRRGLALPCLRDARGEHRRP